MKDRIIKWWDSWEIDFDASRLKTWSRWHSLVFIICTIINTLAFAGLASYIGGWAILYAPFGVVIAAYGFFWADKKVDQ